MDQQPIIEPSTYPVFSKNFLQQPQLVLDHSTKMKKQIEDFIHAFSKRAEVEMTYQKNLQECSKILEKYIDPTSQKCVSYISSAFKVDNEQRGNQARDLAESLKTEVILPMGETSKSYSELIKKSEKSLKKLNKEYSYYYDNYKRSLENYNENDNESKELIITKNIYRYTSEFSQEKKNKLIVKTMESIKEKMEYEKVYRSSVGQYNEVIEIYRKETTEMLNELELAERAQIKLQSDAIRKLIVAEVSMFKNVEYDLINISKQMEKMYAESDILAFKAEAVATSSTLEDTVKDLTLKHVQADKSLLQLSLRNVEDDYYQWLLSLKKNKIVRKAIEQRMKELLANDPKTDRPQEESEKTAEQPEQAKQDGKEAEGETKKQEVNGVVVEGEEKKNGLVVQEKKKPVSGIMEEGKNFQQLWDILPQDIFSPPSSPKLERNEILEDFKKSTALIHKIWMSEQTWSQEDRQNFIRVLNRGHFIRVMLYLFIEEYRIEHHVLMKWENYQKAGEIFKIMIDLCEKMGDVFTIKGLLGLAFTFYSIENEKAKKLLYQLQQISHCEAWKRDDYWEASIFESTYEEMANFSVQKGETQAETLLREKNIIFSQLASYCHYMLMLGCTSKSVRRIVGRFCRLYEMSDDQNRDLSKMISNTTRQIKEAQLIKTVAP